MKKMPTVFLRNPENRNYLLRDVTPGCEWVFAGEGVPTRKYDGTCVLFDGQEWWARREVKPGKATPPNFRFADRDEITGKTMGWEPMAQSGWIKPHAEAVALPIGGLEVGTYELCGPKINRNPEGYGRHVLVRHSLAERLDLPDLTYDGLQLWLQSAGYEGIVWHHPDGRMAKLKAKDFPS